MSCKQCSTQLPPFTYTTNRYDTDTTAGALCLQKSGRGGVPLLDGHSHCHQYADHGCTEWQMWRFYWSVQKMSEGGRHRWWEGWIWSKGKSPKAQLMSDTGSHHPCDPTTIHSSLDTLKIKRGQSSKREPIKDQINTCAINKHINKVFLWHTWDPLKWCV